MARLTWRQKRERIHDMAAGMPHAEIAEKHGISVTPVDQYAKFYRAGIEAIRARRRRGIDDELFGNWITKQKYRLAELEKDYEILEDLLTSLEDALPDGHEPGCECTCKIKPAPPRVMIPMLKLIKVRLSILKQAAEGVRAAADSPQERAAVAAGGVEDHS